MKNRLIYILFGLSLVLNIFYFKYDTVDYIWPKIKNKFFEPKLLNSTDFQCAEKKIIESSLKMLSSGESVMVWDEGYGLTHNIVNFKNSTNQEFFRRYNYPRAFLFYGLSKYLISINDTSSIKILKKEFDNYISTTGEPTFNLDKVDQVVFGLTALELFKISQDQKYVNFSKKIDHFIFAHKDKEDVINYRINADSYLNDVLGMIIPYLVEIKDTLLAEKQIKYFIDNGVDRTAFLPVHSFNRNSLTKSGSSNWGRGIGWYYIALAHYYKETGKFKEEYYGLTDTINRIKNSEGLWSQFPGSSDKFDASTSTMFLYGQTLVNTKIAKSESTIF
jgi:rhamnogalacturonyl hydrolase YesR